MFFSLSLFFKHRPTAVFIAIKHYFRCSGPYKLLQILSS